MAGPPELSQRIARVLAIDPSAPALEFEHEWYRWRDLAAAADAIAPHVAMGERVAVPLRHADPSDPGPEWRPVAFGLYARS